VGTWTLVACKTGNAGSCSTSNTQSTQTFTVTKPKLTVTCDNKSRDYGDANPPLTGTLTGVKNGDNITASYSTIATQSSNVGTYPITATLSDPGNKLPNYTVTNTAGTLTIVFNYSGFLQPINDTAHQTGTLESKFKLGQTIPVKFIISDAAGTAVQQATNPVFTKSANRGACDAATLPEAPPVVTPDSGNQYIFTGGQYHYNWSTKSFTAGEYRIFANLADGSQPYVDICLTK
jgi:MBG domain (YGX type)